MSLQAISAGMAVTLYWQMVQGAPVGLPVPFDPANPPAISIYDPTGAIQLTAGVMTQLQSGLYAYEYVTPASPTTAQLGIWTSWVSAVDANGNPISSAFTPGQTALTPSFRLVAAPVTAR